MQPIRFVSFREQIQLANGDYTTEVWADPDGPFVDYAAGIVRIGSDEYPLSNVKRIAREPYPAGIVGAVPDKVECPECKTLLLNTKALGSHRYHMHGVKGRRAE